MGAGEFQCYDEYMLSMLHAAALETGHAEYGHGGPHDAGSYCQWPQQTKFFRCATSAGLSVFGLQCLGKVSETPY